MLVKNARRSRYEDVFIGASCRKYLFKGFSTIEFMKVLPWQGHHELKLHGELWEQELLTAKRSICLEIEGALMPIHIFSSMGFIFDFLNNSYSGEKTRVINFTRKQPK